MSLFNQVNDDIKSAMLAKEKEKLEALRAIKSAFLLAQTEKGSSGEMSANTELKIIQKLVKQRKDSADMYKENGRDDLCEKELLEVGFISKYLPAQLSEDEIVSKVKAIVEQVGAKGVQDMGKVMGAASKEMSGKADNKIVAAKVKEVLGSL